MHLGGRSWPHGLQPIEEDAEVEAMYRELTSSKGAARLCRDAVSDPRHCRYEKHSPSRRAAHCDASFVGARCSARTVFALAPSATDIRGCDPGSFDVGKKVHMTMRNLQVLWICNLLVEVFVVSVSAPFLLALCGKSMRACAALAQMIALHDRGLPMCNATQSLRDHCCSSHQFLRVWGGIGFQMRPGAAASTIATRGCPHETQRDAHRTSCHKEGGLAHSSSAQARRAIFGHCAACAQALLGSGAKAVPTRRCSTGALAQGHTGFSKACGARRGRGCRPSRVPGPPACGCVAIADADTGAGALRSQGGGPE